MFNAKKLILTNDQHVKHLFAGQITQQPADNASAQSQTETASLERQFRKTDSKMYSFGQLSIHCFDFKNSDNGVFKLGCSYSKSFILSGTITHILSCFASHFSSFTFEGSCLQKKLMHLLMDGDKVLLLWPSINQLQKMHMICFNFKQKKYFWSIPFTGNDKGESNKYLCSSYRAYS